MGVPEQAAVKGVIHPVLDGQVGVQEVEAGHLDDAGGHGGGGGIGRTGGPGGADPAEEQEQYQLCVS